MWSSLWKAGHAALVELYCLFEPGGTDSSVLDVCSNCITLWSNPVMMSSATAQFVTRYIVSCVAKARPRTVLTCPLW